MNSKTKPPPKPGVDPFGSGIVRGIDTHTGLTCEICSIGNLVQARKTEDPILHSHPAAVTLKLPDELNSH